MAASSLPSGAAAGDQWPERAVKSMAISSLEKQQASGFRELEAEVLGDGWISAADVLKLRREIYREGGIARDEAAFLFHLNRKSLAADPAWAEFYLEALTDFFYWREGTDSRLTQDAEAMLFEWLGPAAKIDDATELRLLLSLVFRSNGSSERFQAFVLEAVRHSVLRSSCALYGHAERRPGAIDRADVEVIRKLVYGLAGQNGMAIGKAEAKFLFDLNDATADQKNDPAWRDLFVKAITMYLLHAGPSPDAMDEDEARWLVARIEADGKDHDNERALLAYLRREAARLPASLEPLCRRFGV
jgi:hypothetical protein